MNDYELEELRGRVARRKLAAEKAALEIELNGRNNSVDPSAIYLSAHEAAEIVGCCATSIVRVIRNGELPRAIKGRGNRNGERAGTRWCIHPDDLDYLRKRFVKVNTRT
jgi:hypothetical protein